MQDFKKLKIWENGLDLAARVFKFTATLPKEERFGLVTQLNRCSVSISSNIAEGNSRSSEKEKAHFMEIALGSTYELETQLLLTELIGLGDPVLRKEILILNDKEQKMIQSFWKKIKAGVKGS